MGITRISVRVPLEGEVTLSNSDNPLIKARTIDISHGGAAAYAFSEPLSIDKYRIEILTEAGQRIELFAQLVRVEDATAGFQTLQIDQKSQKIINDLIFEYQKTTDFIKQLDEFNLLNDIIVDEEGNEIEITFEEDVEGNR
jgi:c-di-GMP-binding flagellar brake protein YcgR